MVNSMLCFIYELNPSRPNRWYFLGDHELEATKLFEYKQVRTQTQNQNDI